MVAFLMILLAVLVLGIVYVLLRFSAEEEARAAAALDTWRERSAQRRPLMRDTFMRGPLEREDDGGDDAA